MLVFFFLRSFYFTVFELAWRGTTPGKRVFGLRVIDRGGGTLRADAVFARNLMREVEVFMPAMILMIGPFMAGRRRRRLALSDDPRLDGRADAAAAVQQGPPAGRRPDRRHLGDPGAEGGAAAGRGGCASGGFGECRGGSGGRAASASRRQHLAVYGVEELHTLEHILRQDGPHAAQVRDEVARRIQRKINWESPGQRRSIRAPSCRPSTLPSAVIWKRGSCSASGARTSSTRPDFARRLHVG